MTVPAGVSVLGGNSFTFCPRVTEVTLPASVARIDRGAFSASLPLGRLNFMGLLPDLGPAPVWPGETFVTSVAQGYRIDAAGGWDQLPWNLQRPLDQPERLGGMVVTPLPVARGPGGPSRWPAARSVTPQATPRRSRSGCRG